MYTCIYLRKNCCHMGRMQLAYFQQTTKKKKKPPKKSIEIYGVYISRVLFPNIKAIISNYANFMESRDIHIHFI